ncbi:DNA-3-methyladenine glycosylase 2 family protein [Vibrio hepatarius]|uniref:DNA-3-methyladenine glycosylase 2 family protein n=1 Tax=Vibrio hepatarius TaxID=171383 RepID=UPI001C08CA14|nr:AlkA N-terminal domain-containing protein [Vibrio hepatarius]MBU2896646.1 helix-turn-helix domain-containing protein [Vibrio hepatarius]
MNLLSQISLQECQSARQARDARFDGLFYVAVKTTGIFCRPICPANLPKEENVEYFFDKAQPLKAGYRPCLRCRPDSAPNSWAWKGVETTFLRAIKLIDQGELQSCNLDGLSQKLGISDRYLRKLFQRYLGMPPKQYALYHQLMFAKQLLHSSSMSITHIAFASGFASVRRFNDAFKQVMKLTPTQMRQKKGQPKLETNYIDLSYKGPLDWQHMLEFYRLRAVEGLEWVDKVSYQRRFNINGASGIFSIYPIRAGVMRVEFELSDHLQLQAMVNELRRMFDLDSDILAIENVFNHLSPKFIKRSGIRIPGVLSTWEGGVRAILGQQVSIKAAIGQLNLLVSHLQPEKVTHFPTPQEVSQADVSFLRMPKSRKQTLLQFAKYMQEYPEADCDTWLDIKGIGPWTIHYAKLRGASNSNCFLDGDLVVKKILKQFPELTAESVSPWGSYATFHCWSHA